MIVLYALAIMTIMHNHGILILYIPMLAGQGCVYIGMKQGATFIYTDVFGHFQCDLHLVYCTVHFSNSLYYNSEDQFVEYMSFANNYNTAQKALPYNI